MDLRKHTFPHLIQTCCAFVFGPLDGTVDAQRSWKSCGVELQPIDGGNQKEYAEQNQGESEASMIGWKRWVVFEILETFFSLEGH